MGDQNPVSCGGAAVDSHPSLERADLSARGDEHSAPDDTLRPNPELWAMLKPLARQMRHDPTPAEQVLWQALRGRGLNGLKFRRQHAIGRLIADFYCREARLLVEVDGSVHDYSGEQDAIRQQFLESLGLVILRFSNQQVLTDLDAVLERIEAEVEPRHQES